MNDEQDLVTEETEIVEPHSTEVLEEVETTFDQKQFQSALAQKEHFRKKFEKEAMERKALEEKLRNQSAASLDVEDYINISASLDGLDPREKAYLAEQHRLSGKPLKEIRENEDFQFWQEAYRARQAKENALKPNATQEREDAPKSFVSKLATASMAEKEELLRQAGLYRDNRNQSQQRADIGSRLSR